MESYGLAGFTTFTTTLSSLIVLLNIVIALLHLRKSRSRLLLSLPRYGHSSPLMAASFPSSISIYLRLAARLLLRPRTDRRAQFFFELLAT